MAFDSSSYGSEVHSILALHGDGLLPMPLAGGQPVAAGLDAIAARGSELFSGARHPQAALSGLYLYFCGYDESHRISQDLASVEGSFWHGIMHRQEPDPGNAAYWFRRVGRHPLFPALHQAASDLGYSSAREWDPFAFIDFCETARHKAGSRDEDLAMSVQLAEWQLLFDYCARPRA